MMVADKKVVGMEYTLKNTAGEILDSNEGEELLYFIQGEGNIVPGLEKAMAGKSEGDHFEVTVKAAEGYGEYDEERIRRIPRSQAKNLGNVKVGAMLQMRGPHGVEVLKVTHVTEQEIVADANHELAGQDLFFTVHVAEIRDATKEELEHGHAHGPGGHHHH
jgi:FKBP-type peptidyl-prolyl cis-trans isomerase SlyD